ncbi:hypothetical protein [Streptomyces nitrosporeus]|uniref:hypothetical protein n=1 Tax=Streptomyces nitrosporeus TaxID=28894 RepID=UPI00167CDCC4|nr:hypothetical protein [Streptomyces nitrosporeus]GGZ30484.1 hypothetical protein GCM10010327_70740 [Streptomyces nitrosporeus]
MSPRRKSRAADFVTEEMPAAPTAPPSVRTKPVRVTLDLAPGDHRDLKRWCNQTAVALDLSQVPLAPVLRLLGQELLANPALADRIRNRLSTQADLT